MSTSFLWICIAGLAVAAASDALNDSLTQVEIAPTGEIDQRSLIQRRAMRSKSQQEFEQDPAVNIDGAHLVCHSEGCKEVTAQLTALQAEEAVAKKKLSECATSRAALQADLAKAGKARGEAEVALAKCATERAKLQADLAKCGQERGEAEGALAACAADRAKLEAELKQCAEVDRPNAEKALAQCGEERGKLEQELAAVIKKLKAGSSSRRRRRRRAASLLQEEAQVDSEAEAEAEAEVDSEEAQLLADEGRIRARLAELVNEAGDALARLDEADNKAEEVEKKMEEQDGEADKLLKKVQDLDAVELATLAQLEDNELKEEDEAKADFEKADAGMVEARMKMKESAALEAEGQAELVKNTLLQTKAAVKLLQLNVKEHDLRETIFAEQKDEVQTEIERLQKVLVQQEEKGDAGGCEATRGELVTRKAALAAVVDALKDCLNTKKILQEKIDAANSAREEAEKGLADCLKTKAQLKAALEECHKRRDATRVKLKECLDRKEVLKKKIKDCHDKRDEALRKLSECLNRKAELKKKISEAKKKMGAAGLLEADVGKASASSIMSDSDVTTKLKEALEELQSGNADFNEFMEDHKLVEADWHDIITELKNHGVEEGKLLSELTAEDIDQSAAAAGLGTLKQILANIASSLEKAGASESAAGAAAAASAAEAEQASR